MKTSLTLEYIKRTALFLFTIPIYMGSFLIVVTCIGSLFRECVRTDIFMHSRNKLNFKKGKLITTQVGSMYCVPNCYVLESVK